VQGPLVVTERGWRSHEKERHVFLFQLGILLCRKQELSLGRISYVFKQKIMVSAFHLLYPCVCTYMFCLGS